MTPSKEALEADAVLARHAAGSSQSHPNSSEIGMISEPASCRPPGGEAVKRRWLAIYVLFLVVVAAGVLKAAAVRDRQYMERFGGMHQ